MFFVPSKFFVLYRGLITMRDTKHPNSLLDEMIISFDHAIRTLFGKPQSTNRPYPAQHVDEASLTLKDKRHIAALMRINHAGEVSAQGLYQGQALTARLPETKDKMKQSALEENDHLYWCEKRLTELKSHTSFLNPIWYSGSFMIGMSAGILGDPWSLGFVEETEYQVINHLNGHLEQLPCDDLRTKKIIEQLKSDEAHHAHVAKEAGAKSLPLPIKMTMRFLSKIMTKTAYWI